jgi:hypothetical protein
MKLRTALAAAAIAFAACGPEPTSPELTPVFSGGHTFGGGNATGTVTTSTSTAAGDDTTCAILRGGHTFGGGNHAEPPSC